MSKNVRIAAAQARIKRGQELATQVEALGLPNLISARAMMPGRSTVLLTSMALAGTNPFKLFQDAAATEPKAILVPNVRELKLLGFSFGLKVLVDDEATMPLGWATPTKTGTADDTAALLRDVGAEEKAPGEFVLHGLQFDTNKNLFAGAPCKRVLMFVPDGTDAVEVEPEQAMFWLVLGAIAGSQDTAGKAPQKVFLGYVRVMYAKAHEDGGYGYKDPATEAYLSAKLPVFQLGWGRGGYTVKTLSQRSSEEFARVTSVRAAVGSHAQGKFLIDLKAQVLGVEVDASGKQPLVYMASVATAKWFKRLTLGCPLQLPLWSHDVGYFKNAKGADHHGRFTKVLFLEDGINLPYLGNAIAMTTRKGMAAHFGAYSPVEHTTEWAGVHTPALPVVGTVVRKDDVLVAGPDALVASVYGWVIGSSVETQDNKTSITVVVGNVDRTGQVKARSQALKASLIYQRSINPQWEQLCKQLGLPKPQQEAGDVAILSGLEPGDVVDVIGNQDVNKGTGKGNAQALVSLAANEFKTEVIYSPKAHAEGQYDGMTEAFKVKAARKGVVIAYAVLNEIADMVEAAGRDSVKIYRSKDFAIVVETTNALLGTDLLKVESLSVRESLTTGYSPIQVALAARAQGLEHGARMIVAGGESLVDDLIAVHEIAMPGFDKGAYDTFRAQGVAHESAVLSAVTLMGKPLSKQGVPMVDICNLDDARREALLRRSADVLALPKRTAFVDTEDGSLVVVDPRVMKAFGSSDNENSIKSLFAQLCFHLGHGDVKLAKQLVRQLAGLQRKLATAAKVNKRAAKGSISLQAKRSAGNVPSGWVAVSYKGNVAKKLVKQFGVSSVDDLMGRMVYVYRSPQVGLVPLRLYFPDAPQADLLINQQYQPDGRVFLKSIPNLEPDRFYQSPEDIAADNGDCDGDGANLIAITCAKAEAEARAYDRAGFRQAVLKAYQANPTDPVTEAFKQDASKRAWAKVGVVEYNEFVALSQDSIVNQTLDIGMAYDLAHMYLCAYGDYNPCANNAARTIALFCGQYEEQLAGLDKGYRKLYSLLQDDSTFRDASGALDVAGWQAAVKAANAGLGHSEADSTAALTLFAMTRSARAVARGKDNVTVKGLGLAKALIGGLVRDLAKGVFDDKGELLPIFANLSTILELEAEAGKKLKDLILEKASEGSIGCSVLQRFIDRVFPLIVVNQATKAANSSDED